MAMADFVTLIMTLGGSKSTLGRLKRFYMWVRDDFRHITASFQMMAMLTFCV